MTYPTSTLTVGQHSIGVSVVAEQNYTSAANVTPNTLLTVTQTTPVISVTSMNVNAGTASTTLRATVSFTGATPAGQLVFRVDGVPAGATTCAAATSTTETCTATFASGNLSVGPHSVVATLAADSNYTTATGSGTLTITTVAPGVTVSPVTITYTTATATLTASVTYSAATAPTGAFTFQVDSGALVTATCTGASSPRTCTASYSTASLMVGSHTITGTQAADATYTQASGTATLSVTSTAPAITFNVPNHTYGDAPFTVAATSPSTGSFIYTVVSGPAIINVNSVSITGVGTVVLQAAQAADANYTAGSKQATFTIAPAPLTVSANNATRVYGAANPTFSGTITGQQYGNQFTESFATTAVTLSPVGMYAIVPAAAGAALPDYTVTTNNGSLTVTQAGTITMLTASAQNINPNQTVTLSASVASVTSGSPTGLITFFDNGTALTTVMLNGSAATYTTTLSPGTTHTLTATYQGDMNFLGSTGAVGGTVTVAPLDFTFSTTSSNGITVFPGTTATYSFAVAPIFGTYAGPVTFTVAGLPTGATATFTPATIATTGGAQTVVLNIATPIAFARNAKPSGTPFERGTALFALLLLPALGNRRMRKVLGARLLLGVLLFGGLAGAAALTGCGAGTGFSVQQSQTYSLTVTATSGSLVHTQFVTLTVQ